MNENNSVNPIKIGGLFESDDSAVIEEMAKKEVQPKRKFELHQEILRLREKL